MGFFKSKKSPIEDLQAQCELVTGLSESVRDACNRSLQGKYEYMRPEERADLVREAHVGNQKLQAALGHARSRQAELDSAGGEQALAAESLLLSASLDATQAQKLLNEAHSSLVQGVQQVEEFYGPRSKEAKHLRKVLSQFQAPA